ncbi:MAG: hypothetical protein H0U76_23350 [Ktedonobacteraceae bacterium]|nr:hypothetical protein [Ktedonobacteraceae bacterium]
MPVRFIPISAKREENAFCSGVSYQYVEAVIDDEEQAVTFTRVLSDDLTQTFTLSMSDLDEFYSEYDAHVTGDPRPDAHPKVDGINARGFGPFQLPTPML